jgi:hypothetical protein
MRGPYTAPHPVSVGTSTLKSLTPQAQPHLLDDQGGGVHDAAVLAGAALLDGEPPSDHVQRVGGAHAHDASASARRQPQQRGHLAVAALLYHVLRYPPVAHERPVLLRKSPAIFGLKRWQASRGELCVEDDPKLAARVESN